MFPLNSLPNGPFGLRRNQSSNSEKRGPVSTRSNRPDAPLFIPAGGYGAAAVGLRWLGRLCFALAVVTALMGFIASLNLEFSRGFAGGFRGHDEGQWGDATFEVLQASVVLAATGCIAVLLAPILNSLQQADPFDPANPRRLRGIAAVLAVVSALHGLLHLVPVNLPAHDRSWISDAVIFDFVPWLLVILTVVLADIFAYGSRISAENEKTVLALYSLMRLRSLAGVLSALALEDWLPGVRTAAVSASGSRP